jgi:hypothetical protein
MIRLKKRIGDALLLAALYCAVAMRYFAAIARPFLILALAAMISGVSGVSALAQGSRKDDVVFNAQGRPMGGATVRVCTSAASGQPCTPLASLFSDAALTQPLLNPIATDGLGNYTFYAAPGRYEIEISGPGITTKQLPNVILPNDPSEPTFATVTTTSGISAFSLSLSGNLTVSGSAAVTGTLTVGGAPVPSTTQDNQWSAAQRFKGPDPWRDITAYMPPGGCDQSALTGSHTTGTISSGSNALAIAYDNAFKNGCGIFIAGAGPASTLATPAQGTAPNPNVIGASGSTTVHYKVAAIDANFGTSAASAAMTVTTAPSTRTPLNYVGLYWQTVTGAVGYLVYSDAGGSYAPLGYSFDCFGFNAGDLCGAIDKGAETNTWTGFNGFWPLTPPATATNQALVTTINSGAGTTSLVLNAAAANSVSSAFTIPDNSMFIKQAMADAAGDGNPQITNRGTIYIPEGLWYLSTIPFPSSGVAGVKIILNGALQIFGLPVEGNLSSAGTSGQISISGTGGVYTEGNWALACSNISGYQTLGALFVAYGAGSALELSHLCLVTQQAGIIEDSQGDVTTQDVSISAIGSGPMLQVDNNAFFSLFDRTNWNNANNSNTQIPSIWFLGLTNSGHTSVFDFRDNSFIAHTIRMDIAFPSGGGPFGDFVFDGTTSVEDNWDPGFFNLATCNAPGSITLDNILTGDIMAPGQALLYSTSSCGALPGTNIFVHGQTEGFSQLVGSSVNSGLQITCRNWIYESPNSGGSGVDSIGYWGSIFGSYSGCDLGITTTGYDVQTSEVLTAGGNDAMGPAGEQMIGHVFRRPQATISGTGGGSLSAGTYFFKVTAVDVAGRESAPSPEISQTVGASSSISVSASTGIYFPASCNVYFGTSAGSEPNYFNTTAVTNGTCTYTLATVSGALTGAGSTPRPIGNAMRTWLTEENNTSSCLYCGSGGGLGTAFLGFNLTAPQYSAPPNGVQFPFNGGVHSYKFYSASETSSPSGISGVDELYADSAAHRWKKIENNGAAQTVGSADSSACAYQGPATAVTGTGAATTYYTCTLPAGVMSAGQGIIITAVAKHTTGTAAVTYTLSFGGTSTTAVLPGGAANQLEHITYLVMNNAGSSSAQTISTVGQDSNGGTNSVKLDTAAVNTSSAVTINLQFSVAATDAITPEMFLVELKQ